MNTCISNASTICPGTCSSGPLLVVGVTKPSPSTVISPDCIPVAVEPVKSPPASSTSKLVKSGVVVPSLVDFLNIIVPPVLFAT